MSSSPFLLKATIKFHLEQYLEYHPNLIERLLHSIYVDDIITGAFFEDETFDLYTPAKEILRQGGFKGGSPPSTHNFGVVGRDHISETTVAISMKQVPSEGL